MQLTINDWLGLYSDPFYAKFGLPDLVKEALKLEARKLNSEIRKKRDEEMSKLKMDATTPNSGFKSLQTNNIDKYFK